KGISPGHDDLSAVKDILPVFHKRHKRVKYPCYSKELLDKQSKDMECT
ncbi:hypothetical protein NPIL_454131, partial [Nephila pilipes]